MIAGKRVCLVIPELNEFKEAFESAQLLVRKIPEIDKIFSFLHLRTSFHII